MRKIFITGIGTDTGKTIASAVITEALKADYWKPVQCGTEPETDAETVRRLISNTKSRIHREAYCLKEAASPHAAAEKEGIRIELGKITLPESANQTLVIEGAGGLLVPLNENELVADLIGHLNAGVILVVNFYLGSINHSLLTCAELKRRKLSVLGIIFSGEINGASEQVILKQSGLKKLGHIPFEPGFGRTSVLKNVTQFQGI